ncbi:MAG: hypothetical protein NVS2B16_20310 [Chloroflexota bacterium]
MVHRLRTGALSRRHGLIGFVLIALGEALILIRLRPLSDFYFPFVWLGYILFLDAATEAHIGYSLFRNHRRILLAMFPVSALFWWLFELFNVAVHNWVYVGASQYSGLAYVLSASIDFSTVLPAVWTTALFVMALTSSTSASRSQRPVPPSVLHGMAGLGIVCLILPLLLPKLAFGLIWGCMYFLLDPLNYRLGRPSIIGAVWNRHYLLPLSFAFGALICGFFWEGWNYWSMPKWRYDIPYVGFWHIFEMPLLGWTGYLPFGLELFAMTNFVFPLLRLGSVTFVTARTDEPSRIQTEQAS